MAHYLIPKDQLWRHLLHAEPKRKSKWHLVWSTFTFYISCWLYAHKRNSGRLDKACLIVMAAAYLWFFIGRG